MIAIAVISIIALAALFAQWRGQVHDLRVHHGADLWLELLKRIEKLEASKAEAFDKDAFEELKSKVEALRISLGIRGSNR